MAAQGLKSRFEQLAAEQVKDHSVEEVVVVKETKLDSWKHTGNSGGGHTGYDGKYLLKISSSNVETLSLTYVIYFLIL